MEITVRRGDSFWYYSQLYKIPLQLITDWKPEINPAGLSVGQRVRVPGFVATGYQIWAGDTLWGIARSRNLQLNALLLANPGINQNQIRVGQMIRLPTRITWWLVRGRQN